MSNYGLMKIMMVRLTINHKHENTLNQQMNRSVTHFYHVLVAQLDRATPS